MIGNPTTKYTVLTDELNQPLIWKVEADKVIERGDLVIDLRYQISYIAMGISIIV